MKRTKRIKKLVWLVCAVASAVVLLAACSDDEGGTEEEGSEEIANDDEEEIDAPGPTIIDPIPNENASSSNGDDIVEENEQESPAYEGDGEVSEMSVEDRHLSYVNTSNAEGLQDIEGIGEALSNRIIEYREQNDGFESLEDLKNIEGIDEYVIENIQRFIR